jgi:hypothetical protein
LELLHWRLGVADVQRRPLARRQVAAIRLQKRFRHDLIEDALRSEREHGWVALARGAFDCPRSRVAVKKTTVTDEE